MLLRFTSIFKRNSTNSKLYNQNPTTFCSIFIDYNYLCHIELPQNSTKNKRGTREYAQRLNIKDVKMVYRFLHLMV